MPQRLIRPILTCLLIALVITGLTGCNLIKSPQIQGAFATLTASANGKVTAAPKDTVVSKATTSGKATVAPKATAATKATVANTAVPKATAVSKATAVPKATVKPKASATPESTVGKLTILKQGFGQENTELAYGMVVENSGDAAIVNSQYQVTIYDADGAVLATEGGSLALILPGQTLGIAGSSYLNDGQVVDHIEIVLEPGDTAEPDFNAPLTTDQATYKPSDFFSSVLGTVSNPFDTDTQSVDVWSIAYDDAGNIIGGGTGYLNFIAAGTTTGVEVSTTSSGTVASVELYAAVASSTLYDDSSQRVGAENVSMTNQGFGQKDSNVGYGAVFANASTDSAAERTDVHVTFYAQDGSVVSVQDNYLAVILPGETQAVAGSTSLNEGETAASMDIQFRVSQMTPVSALQPLTSENVNYLDDPYSPKVTGQIANPYNKKLESVNVVVIAYDPGGAIIGGGTSFIDFISASKKAAAEVYVTVSDVPDTVEMYASANQLSDLTQ